jgi:predicted hydrocarbon binding protein
LHDSIAAGKLIFIPAERNDMDRKEFLKTSLAAVGTTALLPILNNSTLAAETGSCEKDRAKDLKFRDSWVVALLSNMDANLTPEQRGRIMEANGRACARRIKTLAEQKGAGVDAPFNMLVGWLGKDKAFRNENEMTFVISKCSCPMVGSGPEKLSDTWCNCSVGWFKEFFENATEKPAKVELKSAIKRGDPVCKFVVRA